LHRQVIKPFGEAGDSEEKKTLTREKQNQNSMGQPTTEPGMHSGANGNTKVTKPCNHPVQLQPKAVQATQTATKSNCNKNSSLQPTQTATNKMQPAQTTTKSNCSSSNQTATKRPAAHHGMSTKTADCKHGVSTVTANCK
jgi:hypothetical protein